MNKFMLKRIRLLFMAVIVIFVVLSSRLAYLQIIKHDYYWFRSEENRLTKINLPAPRGEIFDCKGRLLVSNRPGFGLSLMDRGEGYDRESIEILSGILEIDPEEIYSAIQGQLYMRYLPLKLQQDITAETIARVSEKRWLLKGVNIDIWPIRDYRCHGTLAHVLGFLSRATISESLQQSWKEGGYDYQPGDLVGQDGLERVYELYLRGEDGEQLIETNYLGQPINYMERKEPTPGSNLVLTIDVDLQKIAEEALQRRIEIIAKEEKNRLVGRASAVVMDPESGAILAMANCPSYDLNNISKEYVQLDQDPLKPLMNSAIKGLYPIGSTFKMITGTAALEEKKIRDRDILYCPGVIRLAGDTVSCYHRTAHGGVNLYDALALSCNIYFYRAGLAAGIDKLAYYAREYGFGSPTGLKDLPGEEEGIVACPEYKAKITGGEPWYEAETMSAAIGQTFHSITPLQLATYVSIIANGGKHYRPYLVARVEDYQGNTVLDTEPELLRQADISQQTLQIIQEGMRRVTQSSPRAGTAWYQFKDLPVAVAAKTGSAQVDSGDSIPAHSLFVGYAPFEKPEIAVAVIVEHGGIGATGATPVAAEIMEYYFTGEIKGITDND